MSRAAVVLIQKADSPYRAMLEAALDQECGPQGWYRFQSLQESWHQETPLVVVWDLAGLLPVEVHSLATVLAQEEAGVVLVCGAVDDLVREALRATNALALLADPEHPLEVAAALEVASATHRRLLELKEQRQGLEQELAERVVIEKAKRVLMESRGCSDEEAMRLLQKQSRNSNQKLATVARKVLSVAQIFNGHGQEE